MSITQTNNINQIVLTQAEPTAIVELNDNNAIIGASREIVIGDNSVFGDGCTLTVQRFLSSNTGYTNYLFPGTETVWTITATGAGRAISFLVKTGFIKFIANNPTSSTNITIDIAR